MRIGIEVLRAAIVSLLPLAPFIPGNLEDVAFGLIKDPDPRPAPTRGQEGVIRDLFGQPRSQPILIR